MLINHKQSASLLLSIILAWQYTALGQKRATPSRQTISGGGWPQRLLASSGTNLVMRSPPGRRSCALRRRPTLRHRTMPSTPLHLRCRGRLPQMARAITQVQLRQITASPFSQRSHLARYVKSQLSLRKRSRKDWLELTGSIQMVRPWFHGQKIGAPPVGCYGQTLLQPHTSLSHMQWPPQQQTPRLYGMWKTRKNHQSISFPPIGFWYNGLNKWRRPRI